MRECIRCSQQESQEDFSQMLDSLSKHPGLQAALKQQITDGLTAWHTGLNKFFISCPFLTHLDLSKCAAIVSAEDYIQLALTPSANSSSDYWSSEQAASARAAAEDSQVVHPCVSAVTKQQALPLSIKQLLPMLKRLPCLAMLHLCLIKVIHTYTFSLWVATCYNSNTWTLTYVCIPYHLACSLEVTGYNVLFLDVLSKSSVFSTSVICLCCFYDPSLVDPHSQDGCLCRFQRAAYS